MINVGIISFAHLHAHAYAGCVNALPNAQLAAIWDDVPKRGRSAAHQYDTAFDRSLIRFLNRDLDAVIVCSENSKHHPHVEAAAASGKWILCEKPIATTDVDARAMISACEEAGVGLGIAFPCRYIAPLIEARKTLKTGAIGRLRAAACTNNGSFPADWFADPKLSGGGAVMDHTVHVADALRWMTDKEFTSVYCDCGTTLHPGLKTDDIGSLHLEMENGIVVSHVASWNRPESFPTWGDITFNLIGAKGTLNIDGFNQKIDVYSDQANATEWAFYGDDPNQALIADFVQAVEQRRAPTITGEDGLRALQVTLAAYRSAKTGKVIEL